MSYQREIICLNCGGKFYVDREDYETRSKIGLCDKCVCELDDSQCDYSEELKVCLGKLKEKFVQTVQMIKDYADERCSKNKEEE